MKGKNSHAKKSHSSSVGQNAKRHKGATKRTEKKFTGQGPSRSCQSTGKTEEGKKYRGAGDNIQLNVSQQTWFLIVQFADVNDMTESQAVSRIIEEGIDLVDFQNEMAVQ